MAPIQESAEPWQEEADNQAPRLARPAGRETPSIACVVQPGSSGGFQKLFFGKVEIAIPVYGRCACAQCARVPGRPARLAIAGQPGIHLLLTRLLHWGLPLIANLSGTRGTVPQTRPWAGGRPQCRFLHLTQWLPCSIAEATRKHPKADVFINYASFRR